MTTSFVLELNNLVQQRHASWKTEITTTGPEHERVHTCKIIVNGVQYGHSMQGRTKKEATEAAAKTAIEDLTAQFPK